MGMPRILWRVQEPKPLRCASGVGLVRTWSAHEQDRRFPFSGRLGDLPPFEDSGSREWHGPKINEHNCFFGLKPLLTPL